MDPQNRLLLDALTEKMRELLREEVEGIQQRIDQLEDSRNSSGDEQGRRDRRP